MIRQADDTTAALGAAALDQCTSGIPRLLAEADRIGSRLSMMFARRGTKDPAELRQLNAAVALDTSLLRATLRGYQVFGGQNAIHQQRSMPGDEMGLGKTVQALAVLAHLAAQGKRQFLVVCPASVLINWLNEIAKHSRLEAHSLHGPDRDTAARRWLRHGGVAVTTFGTLGALPTSTAPRSPCSWDAGSAFAPVAERALPPSRLEP